MLISINNLDQVIKWFAENYKWAWHLNLFSMARITIATDSTYLWNNCIHSVSIKETGTLLCSIKSSAWLKLRNIRLPDYITDICFMEFIHTPPVWNRCSKHHKHHCEADDTFHRVDNKTQNNLESSTSAKIFNHVLQMNHWSRRHPVLLPV